MGQTHLTEGDRDPMGPSRTKYFEPLGKGSRLGVTEHPPGGRASGLPGHLFMGPPSSVHTKKGNPSGQH